MSIPLKHVVSGRATVSADKVSYTAVYHSSHRKQMRKSTFIMMGSESGGVVPEKSLSIFNYLNISIVYY